MPTYDYATREVYFNNAWMDMNDYEDMLLSEEYQEWLIKEAQRADDLHDILLYEI